MEWQLFNDIELLRPWALLGIPLLLLFYRQVKRSDTVSHAWESLLPKEFIEALKVSAGSSRKNKRHSWVWPVAVCLSCIALSGPSLKIVQEGLQSKRDALVIILDLSLSMLATDQSPNRLTRTKQKISDLLDQRDEGQTALITYAGDSHIVTPLSEDKATLKNMLPALDPFIMPKLGSEPDLAIEQAKQLITQSGFNRGQILLFTDGIDKDDAEAIRESLARSKLKLSIIAAGTVDGGPIPIPDKGFVKESDEIVIVKTDFDGLRNLANSLGGAYSPLRLDDEDIRAATQTTIIKDFEKSDSEIGAEIRMDFGYWLTLPLILLALWQFRSGTVVVLAASVILTPNKSYALEWQDLWKTPDQQGQNAYRNKNFDRAAATFEDPLWKGSSLYRKGDYAAAEKTFADYDSANAHYNRGNALAQQMKIEEAVKAYDEALKQDPNLQAALENKQKLEELLKQQQQNQSEQDQQNGDRQNQDQSSQQQNASDNREQQNGSQSDSQSDQAAENQQQQSRQNQQDGSENPKDSSSQEKGDQQNSASKEQTGIQENQSENDASESAKENERTNSEQGSATAQQVDEEQDSEDGDPRRGLTAESTISLEDQQTEQWLRRIPDDPGGLLRRKFLQESRKRGGMQAPEGDEAIW